MHHDFTAPGKTYCTGASLQGRQVSAHFVQYAVPFNRNQHPWESGIGMSVLSLNCIAFICTIEPLQR